MSRFTELIHDLADRLTKEIHEMGALTEAALASLTAQVEANGVYIKSLEAQIVSLTASNTDEADAAAISAVTATLAAQDPAAATAAPVPEALAVTSGDISAVHGTTISPLTLTASGGVAPYIFTVEGLPASLVLSGDSISGSVDATGITTATVTVTDSAFPAATATSSLVVTAS